MQKYTFLSILFLLFASCKPSTVSTQNTPATTNAQIRFKRSAVNQPQLVQVTDLAPIFTISKDSIPEKDRRHELNSVYNVTHQIYYLPISSKNLTPSDLEIIERTLSLNKWVRRFPHTVEFSFLFYQEHDDPPQRNLVHQVNTPIKNPIEINFTNANEPFVKIHKKDGAIVHSGELFRDLFHVEPFSSVWNLDDWDISNANDIKGLSHPINRGDTVYLLFIQVVQYRDPDCSLYHYYLNPINMDNLDLISYEVE